MSVLDVSGLDDAAMNAVVRGVGETLYRARIEETIDRLPWLLLDEAHTFFDGVAQSALETILTRGRAPGVSLVSASQRPSAVPAVGVSQSDVIVSHRLTSRADLEPLDRVLDGGVPPGSVVALRGPAAGSLDHHVARLTAPRGTLYLSTDRPVANVTRGLERTATETGAPTVRMLEGENAAARIDEALVLIDKLPDRATLLIETANSLEGADREPYLDFLSTVATRTGDIDALAVFVCVTEGERPANRRYLEQYADLVVDLEAGSVVASGGVADSGAAVDSGGGFDSGIRPGEQVTRSHRNSRSQSVGSTGRYWAHSRGRSATDRSTRVNLSERKSDRVLEHLDADQ